MDLFINCIIFKLFIFHEFAVNDFLQHSYSASKKIDLIFAMTILSGLLVCMVFLLHVNLILF